MSDMVNLVRVLTSATGNSTPITLGAVYSQLFMTPAEAGAVDGRTYTYLIVDGNNWELGKGAYTASGNTLGRTTVLASRVSGTLGASRIVLSGTAQVRFVEAAEDIGALRGTRAVTGTSDTIANSDLGRAITYSNAGAIAVSLAQAGTSSLFLDGWNTNVKNTGAGTVTITPATSTINGASTLVLPQNMGAFIWSDGTNYHAYIMPLTKPLLAASNLADVANAGTARTNLGINQAIVLPASVDFNTIVLPGTYFTNDDAAVNAPFSPSFWSLRVETSTGLCLTQWATVANSSTTYTRSRDYAGVWTAWGTVGTVTSVATGAGLTGGPITGSGTISVAAGQLPGTTTNNNATAGNIGEYVSSTILEGSGISAVNSVATNITSISLTAGDWDVWGTVALRPSAGMAPTLIGGWVSSTSATAPTLPNDGGQFQCSGAYAASSYQVNSTGTRRFSLSSTTTIYLSTIVVFPSGTITAFGFLGARRVR